MKLPRNYFMDHPQPGINRGEEIFSHDWHPGKSDIKKCPKNNQRKSNLENPSQHLRPKWKERHLNARHSGSMKTGYKEELPGRSLEHRIHKRKASSTARDSSEDRPGRYDCSPARRQRMESVSSNASDCSVDSALGSDCSVYSPLGSDCSVDSALGSDCSVYSPLGSDCSVGSALGSDCSLDSPLGSDCSVDSALGSDCSVDSALGSDCSVDSPLGSDCSVDSALGSDCSLDSPLGSDCSVDSPLGSDCSVDSALGSDCFLDSALGSKCSADSALGSDFSLDSALVSDFSLDSALGNNFSLDSALGSDCSVDSALGSDCSADSVLGSNCSAESALGSDCSAESALGSDCSADSALGSDCSVDSALGSDCSVDSALGSECSAGSPAESVNSLDSALETDCSVDSPVASDCSGHSKLASDCSVDRPMESDKSVSRTENSNSEPSVSSHDQHSGNRMMDDELLKKIFEKLLERRTYMWRKALLNKRDYSKGRSVRSRKSPVARVTSATSRYSVGSPETTRCSVGSPEASDCPVDSPSIYSVRRVSPQKPQRSQTLGSPLAPVNSATSDCSVDWILSFNSGRSRVNASENIFTEVEMEVLEKTSLKTFLMASHRRAAAAGSEAVHAFSQLAAYVRNFIKEYPEDLERISKDDLNNLNEKDSFTASLLPPSAPASVISMDSPMASVSSVASDCSEDRFLNFSSGNPQSSQPCRHCGSSRMNEGLQRHHSSFKKPFPGRNAFTGRSSQSSLPKASPAASEAYVDSPLASVSSVASDCSEDRFLNFSSGNPQSSQPCSSPARVISMDSPMASVSSVASDCSEDRFLNFSSGNPQSSQPCSSPAKVISMDSPMASVSSVASDCSEDRFLNFSSGNPQSSQPCRHCGSSRMNEGLQRHHSSFKKPFPGKNAFIGRSSQSSLPKASPAASEAYVDSPLASVSSVASDCSEDRFLNFSSGNPQSSQPCSSPARVISMDSPLASVSSVASDCSEDRFLNFSSGNPQSSQPCSAPARVISMDSPLASVSSVASDCSEERSVNFSSGNPQSSQPQWAAARSDAPPVSLHDSGSSCLDTIETTFTDDKLEKIKNYLQSSPNTTSWSAPTPVYCQDSGIEMDETVSFHDDIERIMRFRDVSYYDDLFSIIEDELINLNEKASRTASASPSLPRMAAKEMIIAETASDTLMNSRSGKPNTQRKTPQRNTPQRKPAQRKLAQRNTPQRKPAQPNHNSKPDSSVNKENSVRHGFYNQRTVSSSAHGSFINNGANYRSSGNHFTSVTAQAGEIASHVMFEAVQAAETAAAETAAAELMLKGVQTPAEAEASQLMLNAAQVAAHANKMFMGAQRAAEAAASQQMFREAQRPAETNVMFSEAWKAAAASMVICKAAQSAAAASQLMFKAAQAAAASQSMFKAAQRPAEAGVLFREAQREATASLLMVNAAHKTAIASQSMFKVAVGAAAEACVMFRGAQRPAAAKESYEIYMAVQAEAAAASPFIFKATQRAAAERQFQHCGSCDRCTQYVHLQPHKNTLH